MKTTTTIMIKLRSNLKSILTFLIGISFLLFLVYSRPGSGPVYTVVYTDPSSSSRGAGGGGDPSRAPEPLVSSPSSLSLLSADGSLLPVSPINLEDSVASKQQTDCSCDNANLIQTHGLDVLPTTTHFVPNQAVYDSKRIIIFVITPTYTRPAQMADMTRLANTLRLVPDVFWIVAEDSYTESKSIRDLLLRSRMPFVHLLGPRPPTHMDKRSGRGVSNRLKAFEWLRSNYGDSDQKGVIYFADDDNAYDVQLFEEMRDTRIVSMFPVGLITQLGLSTPIVSNKTGKIIGFHDPFIGRRKFAVDMAGFAVNLQFFLQHPKATMPYKVGYEEDYFLKSLDVKIWQLEPKASNCTKMLVWHTKTKPADGPKLNLMEKVTKYNETNLPLLYGNLLNDS